MATPDPETNRPRGREADRGHRSETGDPGPGLGPGLDPDRSNNRRAADHDPVTRTGSTSPRDSGFTLPTSTPTLKSATSNGSSASTGR